MRNLILTNVSSGYLPLKESHHIPILPSIINILVPASMMTVTLNVSLLSLRAYVSLLASLKWLMMAAECAPPLPP